MACVVKKGLADRVQTMKQPVPMRLGDLEVETSVDWLGRGIRVRVKLDRLFAKVDRDLGAAGVLACRVGDRLPVGLVELDGKQAVLKRVRLEDISESDFAPARDDRADNPPASPPKQRARDSTRSRNCARQQAPSLL